MDGTGLLFEPFVAALANVRPVTLVKYPSWGHSQSYVDLCNFAALALPAEGPLVLLGESFSGPIAISLAAAHPQRVVGLVLCCTFASNPRPNLSWLGNLASIPAPLPPQPILNALLLGRFATPRLRLILKAALASVTSSVLRTRLKAVTTVDVRAQLRTLTMPVLYLKAADDRLVPATVTAELTQACPHMTVQLFQAPHCLLQVTPEAAAQAVENFIRTIADNPPLAPSRMG